MLKRLLLVVGIVLVGLAGGAYLHDERRGPFATGTDIKAFLGTTFEMSPQEVERAIGKRLATCADIERLKGGPDHVPSLIWGCEGENVDREMAAREWNGFAPGLHVFDTEAFVDFDFFDSKLTSVEISFNPYGLKEATPLVETITGALQRSYGACERTEVQETPGAYTLKCRSSTGVYSHLRVIPADGKRPVVTLTIYYPKLRDDFKAARAARDAAAL